MKSPRFYGCFKFCLLCPIANLLWSISYSEARGWQAKEGKSVLSERHLSSLDILSKCITPESDFMEPETSLGIGCIITTKHNTGMRTIQVKFVLLAGN